MGPCQLLVYGDRVVLRRDVVRHVVVEDETKKTVEEGEDVQKVVGKPETVDIVQINLYPGVDKFRQTTDVTAQVEGASEVLLLYDADAQGIERGASDCVVAERAKRLFVVEGRNRELELLCEL